MLRRMNEWASEALLGLAKVALSAGDKQLCGSIIERAQKHVSKLLGDKHVMAIRTSTLQGHFLRIEVRASLLSVFSRTRFDLACVHRSGLQSVRVSSSQL
jgi:hypothetical protein